MKKLLSLFGALFLTATCSTSVVSCYGWTTHDGNGVNTDLSSYTQLQQKELSDAINAKLGRVNILKPANLVRSSLVEQKQLNTNAGAALLVGNKPNFKTNDKQKRIDLSKVLNDSFPPIEVMEVPTTGDQQKITAVEGFNKQIVFGFVKNYLESIVSNTDIRLVDKNGKKTFIDWKYMYQKEVPSANVSFDTDADGYYAKIDPDIDANSNFVKNRPEDMSHYGKIHVVQKINPPVYLGNDGSAMSAVKSAVVTKLYQYSHTTSQIGEQDFDIKLTKNNLQHEISKPYDFNDWILKKNDVVHVAITASKTHLFTGSMQFSFSFTGLLYDITDITQTNGSMHVLKAGQMEYSVVVNVKDPERVSTEELAAGRIFYQLQTAVTNDIESYVMKRYDINQFQLSGSEFDINMSAIAAGDYSSPRTLSLMVIARTDNKLICGSYSGKLMVSAIKV